MTKAHMTIDAAIRNARAGNSIPDLMDSGAATPCSSCTIKRETMIAETAEVRMLASGIPAGRARASDQ